MTNAGLVLSGDWPCSRLLLFWNRPFGGHSRFSLASPLRPSPIELVFETTLELRDEAEMGPDCEDAERWTLVSNRFMRFAMLPLGDSSSGLCAYVRACVRPSGGGLLSLVEFVTYMVQKRRKGIGRRKEERIGYNDAGAVEFTMSTYREEERESREKSSERRRDRTKSGIGRQCPRLLKQRNDFLA